MQATIISIKHLVSEAQCYETIRQLRWQEGVFCPHCDSQETIRRGFDGPDRLLQRYECKPCGRRFDDLTGTALSGHHQPLSTWVIVPLFHGPEPVQRPDRAGVGPEQGRRAGDGGMPARRAVSKKDPVTLSGTVECDETYVVAGHKGQPDKVAEAGRPPRRRRLKGARGRGTNATEKPPVFGLIQRSGEVVVRMLDNVRQETIKPLILETVAAGSLINTDEYAIYNRLTEWNYAHKTVNHAKGEYARDEDGDGFHEVHVNTMEGLWSRLRSWLRPHRGVSQDKLPSYLAFFEFVYNLKRRGKRLLSSLLGVLLKKIPKPI